MSRKTRHGTAWELSDLIRPLPVRSQSHSRQPKLLPHYPAVVEFVFNSRFAIGSQVQRRFPAWLRSQRTAQYQLASLCQLGYLAVAPVRSTGPHFPFVYYATDRGVRLIQESYEQLGSPRTLANADDIKATGHALDSILHEVMITEFSLAIVRATEDRGEIKLAFAERRFFRRERQLRYMADGLMHRVIPDLGFLMLIKQPSSKPSGLLHFVEWDNGTMSLDRIRSKYQQYDAWSGSEQGRERLLRIFRGHGLAARPPNFRLLMIAHDKARGGRDSERMVDLLAEALELPATMRDRIWLTTADELNHADESSSLVSAPLWVRARDARAWLSEYRQQFGSPLPSQGRRFSHDRRQHVLARLSSMPRHTLLPRLHAANAAE